MLESGLDGTNKVPGGITGARALSRVSRSQYQNSVICPELYRVSERPESGQEIGFQEGGDNLRIGNVTG